MDWRIVVAHDGADQPPDGATSDGTAVSRKQASEQSEMIQSMDDGPPTKPLSDRPRRVTSDALLEKIDRQMDEAFGWNVMRDCEIRMILKRLRQTKPNASSVERERIIEAITAKYRMLVSTARSRGANERLM
jgi:predicted Fe-S protein YdhL (DUF1289 family)